MASNNTGYVALHREVDMLEFKPWPKIPRVSAGAIVTEKIDGTNACVVIDDEGNIGAQSRNRLLDIHNDNFGFANWVEENKVALANLGPGHHYGEWWGAGIGRRYNIGGKRFSLFNVGRWTDVHGTNDHLQEKKQVAPACCYVVPVIARAPIDAALRAGDHLALTGSLAAPGWDTPEGYVVWVNHTYSKVVFDSTGPKSLAEAA